MSYDFKKIEEKWAKYWEENETFKAQNKSKKPKNKMIPDKINVIPAIPNASHLACSERLVASFIFLLR